LNNETRPETKERDIINPFGVEDRAIAKVPQSPTQIYFRLFNLDYNQKQTPLIVESWSRSANSTVAEHIRERLQLLVYSANHPIALTDLLRN